MSVKFQFVFLALHVIIPRISIGRRAYLPSLLNRIDFLQCVDPELLRWTAATHSSA